jgi:glucose/arabinose dehydrogenase
MDQPSSHFDRLVAKSRRGPHGRRLVLLALSLVSGLMLSFNISTSVTDTTHHPAQTIEPAAVVPSGFTESQVAAGLLNPTAMAFAPDGRLFVCQQAGALRVIKNGALLPTPFLTVTVNSSGERGLLGVAFDPNFATNNFVYIYYTATTPAIHNRVSRFTANGDVAVPGSEVQILNLNNLSGATNHNGGAIHFGDDDKLYIAVGENANGANAQTLSNLLGKMLRINSDGSIPTDNPFFNTATGNNRAIWALGLRNPFTFGFQPGTGRMFINDVGQNTTEEINDGIAGSNYGWPDTEGPTSDPRFRGPIFSYGHGSSGTTGCAIAGAAFYNPQTVRFPPEFVGDYFFADLCSGWIRRFDLLTGTASSFATGVSNPVDLQVSSDGALYYLARGSGSNTGVVFKIEHTASQAPSITTHPSNVTVSIGRPATFSVTASGSTPLSFQWRRNGVNIPGATSSSFTIASAQTSDNGALFRVLVTNSFGSALSNEATLTVTANTAPTGNITQPAVGTTYAGGNTINFAGTASDAEDGSLPASAFTWQVDFHHADHTHPHVQPTSGITSGSFSIPTTGETADNVFFRILLTVRDSAGLIHTSFRDVLPRKSTVSLATSPSGLQVRLDGQPMTAPLSFVGVVGIVRNIEAVSPQTLSGATWAFDSWSDGGAAAHNISTPATNTTFTAVYRVNAGSIGTGTGLSATYFNNIDFTGTTVTRTDPTVNFDFGTGSPAAAIGPDTFSARWTGQVRAQFTETYTFYTVSDDGVRLFVNGQQIINNFTDHSPTENSGTIALTAGQNVDIRMEYFENGGGAVARLLWSSASTPKSVIPRSQLFPQAGSQFIANINFQPAGVPIPAGYLADTGAVFGNRGNGQSYGWNADNSAQTRDRNAANSPDQRFDTLTHMQKAGNPNARWEIAVPNGTYRVRIVSGDASFFDGTFRLNAETVLALSGTPTSANRWIDSTVTVTVTDGRLSISNASGAVNNKICFIEISSQ